VTRPFLVAGSLLVAGVVALGCKDDSGDGAGNPGAAGSSGSGGNGGGTGGGGTGGSGGAAGTPGFMSIAPCQNESAYVTGTMVEFGVLGTPPVATYAPKCLHVSLPVGSTGMDVTFTGDFVAHPLEPSALRGAQTGNPITATSAGTSKVFRFSTPGFFAYFCEIHNPSDSGAAMSGVVWVTQQELLP
jgi:plastocyanin